MENFGLGFVVKLETHKQIITHQSKMLLVYRQKDAVTLLSSLCYRVIYYTTKQVNRLQYAVFTIH